MSFGGSSFGGVPFDASNTGAPAVGSASPNTASVDLRAIQYWPGRGPYGVARFVAAWPKFQFPYPNLARLTQQYAEVLNSGDPSQLAARVTQQYVEVLSSGDPSLQTVRVTQQYLEVVHALPLQYSYIGAGGGNKGGEWPGAGPNRRERFRGDILNKSFFTSPAQDASPNLTGVHGSAAVNSFTVEEDIPLTGVAGTGVAAAFGLEEDTSVALTAAAATGAVGSFTVEEDIPLTGVFGTGATGEIGEGRIRTTQINQQTLYEDDAHEIRASQVNQQAIYQEADGLTPVVTALRASQVNQQAIYQEADGVHPVVTYVRATQIALQVLRSQGNAPTRNFGQIV